MELLERYLRQIRRYLPFKDREETVSELRSLILDQLDEQTASGQDQTEALRNILIDMGAPRDVALRYVEKGPLISREMEPIMLLVMKIVAITLPLVILFANSIAFVTDTPDFTFSDVLVNLALMIPSALYSMIVAIGMVFIVFVLIERFASPQFEIEQKPFNPDLLPELPNKLFKVSIAESVAAIFFTTLLIYLFNFQQGLVGIYYEGEQFPLLNENFDRILPFLNIGWFVAIVLNIYFLFRQKKTIGSRTVEFITKIYGAVVAILLATSDIFNDVIIEGYDLNFLPNTFKYALLFIAIASIIGAIVEYIKMFINLDNLETAMEQQAETKKKSSQS